MIRHVGALLKAPGRGARGNCGPAILCGQRPRRPERPADAEPDGPPPPARHASGRRALGAALPGAVAVVLFALADARAQQPPSPPAAEPPQEADSSRLSFTEPWSVQVRPRAWWVSPSGKVKLPGS